MTLVQVVCGLGAGLSIAWLLTEAPHLDQTVLMVLIAVPAALLVGVLAVFRFEWFVLTILMIRPSLDAFAADGLRPGAMLATVFLLISTYWLLLQRRAGAMNPLSPGAKALVAFVGAVLLSVLTSSQLFVSLAGATEIVAGVAMFIVLEQLLAGRPDRVRRLVFAVLISGVIPVIVGLSQWLGGDITSARADVGRIQGTFVHPNPFATYLVLLILLTVSLATARIGYQRWVLLGYLAVLCFALVVTYNRASWFAGVVGLLYIGIRRNRWIVAGLVAVLVFVVVAVPSVSDRITELGEDDVTLPADVPDNSLEWRVQYWEQLVPLAGESPLTGIGPQVVANTRPEGVEPHSVFVQAFVETGIVGLSALAVAIVGIGVTLSRRRRAATVDLDRALAVAAIAIATALLVQSPSENLLNQTMTWWYFAAAATWGFTRDPRGYHSDVPDRAHAVKPVPGSQYG